MSDLLNDLKAVNDLKQGQQDEQPHEATCPKCGHKFFHKIKEALKDAAEGLGNAIGEAKFGG
jgi:hypothetical protein